MINPFVSRCVLLAVFSAWLLIPSLSQSQGLTDTFGGFATDSNQPIDIKADELRVNDIKKTAIFRGNVIASQGNFTIRSRALEVYYSGSPQGQGGTSGKVKKLIARGKVLISTKDKQSATSEWADFNVITQKIVLGDEVVLTQGENVIKGGKLMIDLKTRQSRFINQRKKGRVQMKVEVGPNKKQKKP